MTKAHLNSPPCAGHQSQRLSRALDCKPRVFSASCGIADLHSPNTRVEIRRQFDTRRILLTMASCTTIREGQSDKVKAVVANPLFVRFEVLRGPR